MALAIEMWLAIVVLGSNFAMGVHGLGMNWGTVTSHRLPDAKIVSLLRRSGIGKVKLFDADPSVVEAFRGTGLQLMVAIPNDMLQDMAFSARAARRWVRSNVSRHLTSDPKTGVDIRYIAVGNEPFLMAYNGSFQNSTLPALRNVQRAVDQAGIAKRIRLVVPLNADILTTINRSGKPSQGMFRPDIKAEMRAIVQFLNDYRAPFVINIYPFLSLQQDPNFPKSFAFFDNLDEQLIDGRHIYTNVFDASFDLLVSALAREGYGNMPVVIGEVGWPTDGDIHANLYDAQRFNQQLLKHVGSGRGTPLRPSQDIEVYLFSLIDEDSKSILPGTFERHWGVYEYDGKPKYSLNISVGRGVKQSVLAEVTGVTYLPNQWCILNPDLEPNGAQLATSISYACSHADCSTLVYGASCNHIGLVGNASYAFNNYYQTNNQNPRSCDFRGLAVVTRSDPSAGNCKFDIQITPWESAAIAPAQRHLRLLLVLVLVLVLLLVL